METETETGVRLQYVSLIFKWRKVKFGVSGTFGFALLGIAW